MVSIEQVTDYLGIDILDDMAKNNINRMIRTADSYLKGSIGKDYPAEDPRAVELALIIIADLYDNREMTDKVSGNVRRFVNDASLQLKLELESGKNEV